MSKTLMLAVFAMLLLITVVYGQDEDMMTQNLHDAIKKNDVDEMTRLIKGGANLFKKIKYLFSEYDAFDIAVYYMNKNFLHQFKKELQYKQQLLEHKQLEREKLEREKLEREKLEREQLEREQDQLQQLQKVFQKNNIYLAVLVVVVSSFLVYWYVKRKEKQQIEKKLSENQKETMDIAKQNEEKKLIVIQLSEEKYQTEKKLREAEKERKKMEQKITEILERNNQSTKSLVFMNLQLEEANQELRDLKEQLDKEQLDKEQLDKEQLEKECAVCLDRNKNTTLIPCGHVFCKECCRELWLRRKPCPYCKVTIIHKQEIFL